MHARIERTALCLVAVAVVPYTALKVLWLAGGTAGARTADQVSELHSTRMVVGNVVTIGLELLAVALAVALVHPWGRRVPAWMVLGLAAGATGLLAPILVGLGLGSALQLLADGDLRTGGMEDMSPWVFAVAYGGFGLLAVGIGLLAWRYTLDRWGRELAGPPRRPGGWAVAAGAVGLLPFGSCMVWWGLLGPGESGPQGMDAVSQRTVLVVSGLLAVAGWLAPLLTRASSSPRARAAWLVTWTGCTAAAMQAVAQGLLANRGNPTPVLVLLACLAVPGAATYGLAVLRRRLSEPEASRRLEAGAA
ncbi:hypothetical protein [Nocardioides sp. TF02-7]|uniref:hypothetical protein n=1 Tax=Nocardioides sp. TF02-7 TaxID=2917724 RepID=UPI001F06398A|nr:hypothetical protein [Nocardioides sp. TF02-7]UMG91845.1 hypothetical protein MF408_17630 [Nocardioides sp. TF02-7]